MKATITHTVESLFNDGYFTVINSQTGEIVAHIDPNIKIEWQLWTADYDTMKHKLIKTYNTEPEAKAEERWWKKSSFIKKYNREVYISKQIIKIQ